MLFDIHMHLGKDVVFNFVNTEQALLKGMEDYHVDGGIIQPSVGRPYLKDTGEIHDQIAKMCREHKEKKLYGMASINPHFHYDDFEEEARRCVKELDFIGIKITPAGHGVDLKTPDAFHVCETARMLKIPVMVHTGMGIPFADPVNMIPMVRAFPDVTFILAHAGANFYTSQAVYVVENFKNVFIETCGSGIGEALGVVKAVGSRRVMFASDAVIQLPIELQKYESILNEEEKEDVFWKTAEEVFQVKLC